MKIVRELEAENRRLQAEVEKSAQYEPNPIIMTQADMIIDLAARTERLTEELQQATAALHWIATVNESLDLRKMDQKTLIGLIYELRGKAKAACTA